MNPVAMLCAVLLELAGVCLWWRFIRYLGTLILSGLLIERRARELHREGKMVPTDRAGTFR